MNAATWIGLWGGLVSTALGVLQFANWRHARPRLVVDAGISRSPASSTDDDTGVGTLASVERGKDIFRERITIELSVANHGDKALQVAAVAIESVSNGRVMLRQVTPEPLPSVVEPRSSISLSLQKEHVDQEDSICFFGVVDALARRHPIQTDSAIAVISQSWLLPTRVRWYKRRDDPNELVRAFQARQKSSVSYRRALKGDRPFIVRDLSVPPSASSDKQTTDPETNDKG